MTTQVEALAQFTEYFVKNYPGPNTIIGDPHWHAPKIFRAALAALATVSDAQPIAWMRTDADGEHYFSTKQPAGLGDWRWIPLYASPAPAVSDPSPPPVSVQPSDEQREKVMDAIAEALGGAMDCLRVWSAWGVGTMGPDDFASVAEDSDRLAEITDAAIKAILATQPAQPISSDAQPVSVQPECDCENPEPKSGPALVSMECSVHNENPRTPPQSAHAATESEQESIRKAMDLMNSYDFMGAYDILATASATQPAQPISGDAQPVAHMVFHPDGSNLGPYRFRDEQIKDMERRGHTLKPLVYATPSAPSVSTSAEMETGWLVENGKQGDELRYRTMESGLPEWTADPNKAIRFARRIDAEGFAQEDEDAWAIVQHAWHDKVITVAPSVSADATMQRIADVFSIGSEARTPDTILANVENAMRRSQCLRAVEREFFMVPTEADDDYPDEEPGDECPLNWGADPAEYVEQFRAAIAAQSKGAKNDADSK